MVASSVNDSYLSSGGQELRSAVSRRSDLEWSGGSRPDLIDQALRYGRETDTLPALAPLVLPDNTHRSFQSELALGASYTALTELMFNIEYHFDQAAFTATDFNRWLATGQGSWQCAGGSDGIAECGALFLRRRLRWRPDP
jgi:hypothetical protein